MTARLTSDLRRPKLNPAFKRFQILPEPPAIRQGKIEVRAKIPGEEDVPLSVAIQRLTKAHSDTRHLPA